MTAVSDGSLSSNGKDVVVSGQAAIFRSGEKPDRPELALAHRAPKDWNVVESYRATG
jgi:hypothetical protein